MTPIQQLAAARMARCGRFLGMKRLSSEARSRNPRHPWTTMPSNDPHTLFSPTQTTVGLVTSRQIRGLFHVLPGDNRTAVHHAPRSLRRRSQNKKEPPQPPQQRSLTYQRIWDEEAVADLFDQYAHDRNGVRCLNCDDIRALLRGIGEIPADATVTKLFAVADADNNGLIDLDEFLEHTDMFLGDNPARIILVVGGYVKTNKKKRVATSLFGCGIP